jgi:glycosyltransferase involved in cell wall biosynthesis
MILLSVLILGITERKGKLSRLLSELCRQVRDYGLEEDVEILVDYDNRQKTIAEKRNYLVKRAKGKMLVFIDDDDQVNQTYLKVITDVISNIDVDYIGYKIQLTNKKDVLKPTYHSITYKKNWDDELGYFRGVSHINPIKSEIAKQYEFPEIVQGEDIAWDEQVKESGLLKREFFLDEFMYFYDYDYDLSMSDKRRQGENSMRQPQLELEDFNHNLVNFVNEQL